MVLSAAHNNKQTDASSKRIIKMYFNVYYVIKSHFKKRDKI